jgi:hypothetical protein
VDLEVRDPNRKETDLEKMDLVEMDLEEMNLEEMDLEERDPSRKETEGPSHLNSQEIHPIPRSHGIIPQPEGLSGCKERLCEMH